MKERYIFMDANDQPVAGAILENKQTDALLQFMLLEEEVDEDMNPIDMRYHGAVKAIGVDSGARAWSGKVMQQRGRRFTFEKGEQIGHNSRQNLRVPYRFDSYVYEIGPERKKRADADLPVPQGRIAVLGADISSGGVAFYSTERLQVKKRYEIILPMTPYPLIVQMEILREQEMQEGLYQYSAQFCNLVEAQEAMIRSTVFNISLFPGRDKPENITLIG